MTDEKKTRRLKADALLASGASIDDVAKQLGIPKVTVRSWKKKLEAQNNDLNTVVEVDAPTLHQVADKIKETAPAEVSKKVDKLVDGVVGLKILEPKFHTVVFNLLEAAEEMSVKQDLSVKDWKDLSTGIATLYSNIFNKSGVNVNVMNQTQVSGEKLTMFRTNMRRS